MKKLTKEQKETLQEEITKVCRKRPNKLVVDLWQKHPPLRALLAWHVGCGRTGLSLPVMAYLTGLTYRKVKWHLRCLNKYMVKTSCGTTGHIIYYPSYTTDYWKTPSEFALREAYNCWNRAYADQTESQYFRDGVYPDLPKLEKMTSEQARRLKVKGFYHGVIPKEHWPKLKRAVKLEA